MILKSLLISLFLALPLGNPGGPPSIKGKWRSATPKSVSDSPLVYDFNLQENGEAMMNIISYQWDSESETWIPMNAEMICAGDNDNFTVENGYLIVKARENRGRSGDYQYKYLLSGDSLTLWKAYVFNGTAKGTSPEGEWVYETVEAENPKNPLVNKLTLQNNGNAEMNTNGALTASQWSVDGDRLHLVTDGDSIHFRFQLFPHMLCLYEETEPIYLLRRKTDK